MKDTTHAVDASLDTGIVDIGLVKSNINRLIGLRKAAEDASEEYNDAVKYIAGKAGIKQTALTKFVTAKAGEKYADKRAEHGQLSLLFAEYPA